MSWKHGFLLYCEPLLTVRCHRLIEGVQELMEATKHFKIAFPTRKRIQHSSGHMHRGTILTVLEFGRSPSMRVNVAATVLANFVLQEGLPHSYHRKESEQESEKELQTEREREKEETRTER